MTRYLSGLSFLLVSCVSSPKLSTSPDQCYPVPFDHIWVRIPNSTYKEMKGSSYFGDHNLSFYEPNKSPLGTYFGHYITGEFHTLEIFEEKMTYTPEPLGIGFLSETQGCLLEIHKRISDILPNSFELKPDADWGRFTQLKDSPEVALWVTELKPGYVGDPELLINRKAWARWNRRTNKDPFKGEYNFTRISDVTWNLSKATAEQLSKIFLALGWRKIADYSFEHDGTKVTIRVLNEHAKPWDYWGSVGLELKYPRNGFNFGNLTIKSQKNPPGLMILPPPKK